jgi:hypothetical protein
LGGVDYFESCITFFSSGEPFETWGSAPDPPPLHGAFCFCARPPKPEKKRGGRKRKRRGGVKEEEKEEEEEEEEKKREGRKKTAMKNR